MGQMGLIFHKAPRIIKAICEGRGQRVGVDILQLLAESRDYNGVIERFRQAFNPMLEAYLSQKAREAQTAFPPLAQQALQEFLQAYTMRQEAKRIRPLLFCCGHLCLGGKDTEAVLQASISIELLQTALLIHDDIIDRSFERRKAKTMHLLWEDYYERQRVASSAHLPAHYEDEKSHFGVSMGILLGDIASGLAYEALGGSDFPIERKLAAIQTFSEVIHRVAFGEMLDVELGMRDLSRVTEPEILKVYELKTAGYTTEGPLHIGAVLAGATRNELKLLSAYAIPLGIAFQIQDDLLGMFGSYDDIGKDEGSDLIEGKRTPLLLFAWQKSQKIRHYRETLSRPARRHLQSVRELIVATGALKHSLQLIDQHLDRVRQRLIKIERELGRKASSALDKVANYIAQRKDYKEAIKNYAETTK